MREIKFRAWDQHKKKMVYGPTDDAVNPSWVLAMCSANNLEPMQYTGLKDKNGQEIHEGDILDDSDESPMVVKFIEYYASFGLEGNDESYLFFELHWDGMEVIGNIYESPHLLEQPI